MRMFTVVGYWNDADEPVSVAVIEGTNYDIGGGANCSEGGPWAIDVEAVDMDSAEAAGVQTMKDAINWEDEEEVDR